MKNISIAILLCCSHYYAFSQNRTIRNNEIETYRIAYLTQKLDLSSDDAKIFWPIYNSWQKEQTALRKERIKKLVNFRKVNNIDNLSDSQIQISLNNELSFKQKELNLEKKYFNQLKAKLPIKTVGKYFRAQETFKRELLNRYRGATQKSGN